MPFQGRSFRSHFKKLRWSETKQTEITYAHTYQLLPQSCCAKSNHKTFMTRIVKHLFNAHIWSIPLMSVGLAHTSLVY